MKDNYTHITLVCDRSGSMSAVQSDAEGAVNQFITDQKKVDGEASLLLVEFDAPYGGGDDWYHVVHDNDLQTCPTYRLAPRGNTALLDAVGQAIVRTGATLETMHEDDRPSRVVFVIQTDGLENSSRDWTLEKVREAIKRQTDEYNWQFVFLGMGPDTFHQGHAMGVQNVVRASGSGISHAHTHSVMNAYTTDYRLGHTHDMSRARGMTVNSAGQVYDEEGNELDPQTGKRIDA